jgi:CheY-like chemotaxis protein
MMPIWAIPMANALEGKVAFEWKKSPGARFTAPQAKILIVDDLTTNLQVVKGLLSPYRVRTDTCMNGAEAVELVRKQDYDMIFMDHMMPGMDGLEATKRIRALGDERFEKLPIIALTANAMSNMREMFLANGFNDFLAKPLEISKLNEIMERWISPDKREKNTESAQNLKRDVSPAEIEENKKENKREIIEGDLHIEGLDVARGLIMVGGVIENYMEVLEIFCQDVEERLEKLLEVPDESGLALFTIQVHALKSASASIGASEISLLASELESAGKKGQLDFIGEKLAVFTGKLTELVDQIKLALNR